MRLYSSPFSSNARRALMTAVHLGIEIDRITIDLRSGEQRKPPFLKLNPNGKVPVLDDEGFILTESHAIMQYLAEKTPGQTIYPTELRARADVNRWLFWSAQHFQPAVSVLNWEHAVKALIDLGPADPKEVKRGEELFLGCARVLDAHLADREWISGSRLTLADLALGATLMVAERARLPIGDFKHIQSWLKRVQALPAWQQTSP